KAHFEGVAKASDLPLMVYNNPPIYGNDVAPEILASLAPCDTIVAFKDASGDTRRFVDTRNMVGDRFILFCGLDDVVVESVMLGAVGCVWGERVWRGAVGGVWALSTASPREGETLFRLARAGRFEEARPLYDWFM